MALVKIPPIDDTRLTDLSARATRPGRYVLYWMQASQRAAWNHALEFAIDEANRLRLPVVACFGLTDGFPDANWRHYAFMLEGLAGTQQELAARGVQLVVRRQSPPLAALELAADAAMVVTDRGYLRIQRQWRREMADRSPCRVVQVESDVVVPVETASAKDEWSAATLRPKITRLLGEYLQPLRPRRLRRDSLGLAMSSLDISDVPAALAGLKIDRSVPPSGVFKGGRAEARRRLREFLARRLQYYDTRHSDPSQDLQSDMSPYLHFGQVSPIEIALGARDASAAGEEAKADFLEELIVRRELSINFTHYNPHYDSHRCLPAWAKRTLSRHARDRRAVTYSLAELEAAATGDAYWNACMREMVQTGKMHGYMRMYWGKKIIEWSPRPREAFERTLHLNNKYFIDGRDPNGYANVAWLFGLHDRPWGERPIFGTVRYMNAAGLERKFDMGLYLKKWAR